MISIKESLFRFSRRFQGFGWKYHNLNIFPLFKDLVDRCIVVISGIYHVFMISQSPS